jgi:hypothetical protein
MVLTMLNVVAFALLTWANPNNTDGMRMAITVAHPAPMTLEERPSARFLMR